MVINMVPTIGIQCSLLQMSHKGAQVVVKAVPALFHSQEVHSVLHDVVIDHIVDYANQYYSISNFYGFGFAAMLVLHVNITLIIVPV